MKLYRDLLNKLQVFSAERNECWNYVRANMEKAIDYVLLQSSDLQCIICKDKFNSLTDYVTHLRIYKKHVVVFLETRMQVGCSNG